MGFYHVGAINFAQIFHVQHSDSFTIYDYFKSIMMKLFMLIIVMLDLIWHPELNFKPVILDTGSSPV